MKLLNLSAKIHILTFVALVSTGCGKGQDDTGAGLIALITSHSDGDIVLEGELVTFTGTAIGSAETYGDLITYWYANDEEKCGGGKADNDGSTECEFTIGPDDSEVRLVINDINGATDEATVSLSVLPADYPLVTIVSPDSEGLYYSDIPISFQGTVADAVFAPEEIAIEWSSDAGGVISDASATPSSDGEFEGQGSLSEGAHTVTLTGTNLNGQSGTSTVDITVGAENSLPLCEITSPEDGSAGPEGVEITLVGAVSDTDIPYEWLMASWESDLDGVLGDSTPTADGEVSLSWSGLSLATHAITLTVTDEVGGECQSSISYTAGTPPTATISAPVTGLIVNHGDPTTFEGEALDEDDAPEILTIDWSSDIDGLLSTASASESGALTFDYTLSTVGDHVVTLTVTDTDGLYATDSIDLTLNGVPSAPTLSLSPDPAFTDDSLVVSATDSIDPEGDTVEYMYEWQVDGVVSSASTSDTLSSGDTTKDELWQVEVTPVDSSGGYGASSVASITVSNTPPVLGAITITPSSSITTSTILLCNTSVTDADGETPSVIYTWTNATTGSNLGTGVTASLTTSISSPADIITCEATATDSSGDTDSVSTSVVVQNTAPAVSNVAISPNTGVTTSTLLTCSGTGTDIDGPTPTLTYSWSDGSSTLGTTDTLQLTNSTISPSDVVTCTVTATDSNGGSGSGAAYVSVLNTDPTLSAVTITPSTGVKSVSTLICSATSTDDDGDTPTLSYVWTNGVSVLGSTSSVTLTATTAQPGDTVECDVTSTDAYGSTVSGSSSVSVENSLPSITSVSITPTTPTVVDALYCTYTGYSDDDNDTDQSTYSWSIGSSVVGNAANLSGLYSAGDIVTCEVTPNDGAGAGTALSVSVTIQNTAPVVNSVALSLSPVYTDDTITPNVTSSDADGDSITLGYAWYVDGSLSISTHSYLDGTVYFSKDQVVYVDVTPTDGTTVGTTVTSASITISNTLPTAPTIGVTPAIPSAGFDDIVCAVTTSSTDTDNDTITYDFEWTLNSVIYTGATKTTTESGDTIEALSTAVGDTWECTVTPNDGDGHGGSDSASVTVISPMDGQADWLVEDTLPQPLTSTVGAVDEVNDRLLIYGGRGYNALSDNLYEYDLSTQTWATVSPSGTGPGALFESSSVFDDTNGTMWIFGGMEYYGLTDEVFVLDASVPSAESWTLLSATTSPEPRYGAAAAFDQTGQRMLLIGGEGYNTLYDDIWELDLTSTSSAAWTELFPSGTGPERAFSVAVYDPENEAVYLIGGESYNMLAETPYCLDLSSSTPAWSVLTTTGDSLPYVAGASATWAEGYGGVLLFGGMSYNSTSEDSYFLEVTGTCTVDVTAMTSSSLNPGATVNGQLIWEPTGGVALQFGGESYYNLQEDLVEVAP